MDPLVVADVLAQRGDGVVAEHSRVERVAALLGRGRGVGRRARVAGVEPLHRHRVEHPELVVGGVHHHGRVGVGERARPKHDLLASPALLGGGSHDGHPPAGLAGQGGQGEACAQARRGDDVVAAGVADPGEGVVLAHHRDHRSVTVAGAGLEGGVEAVGVALHGQAVVGQHLGEQVVRMLLLEAQLGPGVDAVRHVEQLGSQAIDLVARPLLGFSDFHGCDPRGRAGVPAPDRGASQVPAGIQTSRAPGSTRRLRVRARARRRPSR